MCPASLAATPALDAYESLAFAYDAFTSAQDHEALLGRIEELALAHGLRGRRLLDLACGTGRSFAPMLRRGYDVTACDLSPEMVRRAARRHPRGTERVFVADVRDLGGLAGFDLATCLNDSLNYVVDPGDLALALAQAACALRPGGLLVFDLNTRGAMATAVAGERAVACAPYAFRWRGDGRVSGEEDEGGLFQATIEVRLAGPDGELLSSSTHLQRHHPRAAVEAALERAGLDCLTVLGHRPGALLAAEPDEEQASKLLYIARRPGDAEGAGGAA